MSNGLTDVPRTVDPPPLDILEVMPDPLLKLLPPTRVVVVISLTVDSRFLYWVGGWLYRLDEAGRLSDGNEKRRGHTDMVMEFTQCRRLCQEFSYVFQDHDFVINIVNIQT
jgi:hypothetical protein